MSGLSQRHLIAIKDLEKSDIQLIFDTAKNFKEVLQRPIKKVPSLRDITIANLFFEDSTRFHSTNQVRFRRIRGNLKGKRLTVCSFGALCRPVRTQIVQLVQTQVVQLIPAL